MHSKTVYALQLCLVIAFAGCDSGGSSSNPNAGRAFHYYDGGEAAELTASTVAFSIRFVDGLSDEQKNQILASEPSARSFDDQISSGDHEADRNVHAIALHPGLTIPDTLALLDRLSSRDDVIFANPGMQQYPEQAPSYHAIYTDRFSASFDVATPQEDIDALNASFAVEVIEVTLHEILGIVMYAMRVTEATGLDALDAANAYFENKLTLDAGPRFQPLAPWIDFLPSITLLTPEAGDVSASGSFVIQWEDRDPNTINPGGDFLAPPDAEIRLFLDTDNEGRNGMLIAGGISEDDETDSFVFDTRDIPEGTYYIFAEMYDRLWPPVYSYSPGALRIEH